METEFISFACSCFLDRTPEDEFLVLASDGVWDVIDNPGMVTFLAAEVRIRSDSTPFLP